MKFYHVCDNGYKYDKRIFWGMMGAIVLLMVFIAYQNNFNFSYKFYFNCEEDICNNPYTDLKIKNAIIDYYDYKGDCTEEWCNQKLLTRGEYGQKPPSLIKKFPLIVIFLVIVTLILNHLIHNRGIRPSVKINLPDKWINKSKEVWRDMEDGKHD